MDLAYKQEATVGTLVIAAFALFFAGTTWLSGRSLGTGSDKFYKIQFHDAANLKASSVVRISGVPVGKVEKIALIDVGKVLVSVSVPKTFTPRVDASATVVAVGFVGDAAIEFDPTNPGAGHALIVIDLSGAKTGDSQRDEALPADAVQKT